MRQLLPQAMNVFSCMLVFCFSSMAPSAVRAEVFVDLLNDFSVNQGANGLRYLSVGDERPSNTMFPISEYSELTLSSATDGILEIPNGSVTHVGPTFVGQGNLLPYVMKELNFLLLHPEGRGYPIGDPVDGNFDGEGARAAAIEFTVPESGPLRIAGVFARANDFQNAGNGVDVGIFVNQDFANPLFSSAISSDHVVNAADPFSGTGVASFDLVFDSLIGDTILFAVFADPSGVDATFDITALRASITSVPEPSSIAFLLLLSGVAVWWRRRPPPLGNRQRKGMPCEDRRIQQQAV